MIGLNKIIVRPCGFGSQASALNGFFSPYGWHRHMYSDVPTYKDTGSPASNNCTAAFGLTKTSSVGDPTVERYGSLRFASPQETDSHGADGFWCVRSNKFAITLNAGINRGQVYYGETGISLAGMRAEIWLLDQYFDYSLINWDNRNLILDSGYKIECYISGVIDVANSSIHGTYNFVVELPDLADGSGPPKIYGCALRVFNDPEYPYDPEGTPGVLNHWGTATMTVQAYQMNARRGADAETGIPVPSTVAPRWIKNVGWATWSPAFGGYIGEWENAAYLPSEPYTFAKQVYVPALHRDPQDCVGRVTCVKDSSVVIRLVAVDADALNSALTYSIARGPYYGTLSGSYPDITYTPTPGYSGSDFFDFKVQDADSNLSYASGVSILIA